MTVKKSPSDNGDGHQHTEDDTFRLLRRPPVPDAYYTFRGLMTHILLRDKLKMIDVTHPEIDSWLRENGWTADEIVPAYNKWLRENMDINFE